MDPAEGTPSPSIEPTESPVAPGAPAASVEVAPSVAAPVAPVMEAVTVAAAPVATAEAVITPAPTEGVPSVSASDVTGLVARARAAQPAWGAMAIEQRVRALASVRDRILERAEAIGAEVHRETGKPEVEALLGEVLPAGEAIDYWCRGIEELLASTEVELDRSAYPGKTGWAFREPRGTVGVITSWSHPVAIPLRTVVPALLAGNTVVWKPSEVAPGSAKLVEELFTGLLPDGVLVVAQGTGDVGQALAEADVDLVAFVGSAATGKNVAKACAERLSPCSLDLGGKDAAIVLADANLERAANGIVWAALTNAGQSAAAASRVYVERAVAEAFVDRLKTEVALLQPGVDVGALTTEHQRETVARLVGDAVARGGTVVQGGATSERFVPPIVVRVESDESSLMQEQTFGPVIPVAIIADVEEAVARVNASKYGLTASVWSKNTNRAEQLAHRLRVGIVTINNHGFTAAVPAAPWSGYGASGHGVTSSPSALDTLTRPRFVLTDTSNASREMWWFPYTPALRTMAVSMALMRGGKTGFFRKLGAMFALLGAFMKRWKRA